MLTVEKLIALLKLKPLRFEGGFYTLTYKSEETVGEYALPSRYSGKRAFGSAIYFLITPESFSAIHKLKTDEIWHFYLGDTVEMLQLYPDGSGNLLNIGNDLANGIYPQVLVNKDIWQGAKLKEGGKWALLGNTLAPGYEDSDFELAKREDLLKAYPDFREMIFALTRSDC